MCPLRAHGPGPPQSSVDEIALHLTCVVNERPPPFVTHPLTSTFETSEVPAALDGKDIKGYKVIAALGDGRVSRKAGG